MYENYSVLFVDDELSILSALRRGMLDEEFSCHFAENAIRACDIMEAKTIHILVTDMRMPEMNGLDLLKYVEGKYPNVVKLVLSGYAQLPQLLATINQVDIFNFITKPWGLDELIMIIHKALDHYILQEENVKYKELLETKNQSYVNILKRIDDVIDNSKKCTELIKICGKEIFSFGKDFSQSKRIKYHTIFQVQYDIFELFSNALSVDRKSLNSNQLISQTIHLIRGLFPGAMIDSKVGAEHFINVNQQMLDAILSSVFILFREEFEMSGLYLNFVSGNNFTISIISPNVAIEKVLDLNVLTVLDTKILFLKNIVDKIFDLCHISMQLINKDGSLVVGFSFEEL